MLDTCLKIVVTIVILACASAGLCARFNYRLGETIAGGIVVAATIVFLISIVWAQ